MNLSPLKKKSKAHPLDFLIAHLKIRIQQSNFLKFTSFDTFKKNEIENCYKLF